MLVTVCSLFFYIGGSLGDVSEEPGDVGEAKKGWRMSNDVGQATEGLENDL